MTQILDNPGLFGMVTEQAVAQHSRRGFMGGVGKLGLAALGLFAGLGVAPRLGDTGQGALAGPLGCSSGCLGPCSQSTSQVTCSGYQCTINCSGVLCGISACVRADLTFSGTRCTPSCTNQPSACSWPC